MTITSSTNDRFIPMATYGVCGKNKITIEEGEDLTPGEMMFLYDINNNKTIYDMLFLGGYQDEYEYIYLYQEINNYLGWNQNKKNC